MEHDRELRRFELDTTAERQVAALRLAAACVVVAGAVWLAWVDDRLVPRLVAIVGALAGCGWILAYRRGHLRARRPEDWSLVLRQRGLTLVEGGRASQVRWQDVTGVWVDEDRLAVIVGRRDAEPLAIEPRYRGVSLQELHHAIETARGCISAPADYNTP